MALNTSHLTLYLVFSVCSRITEKENEAFFIFLFWVVDPSSKHKTLLKCCLYSCKAVESKVEYRPHSHSTPFLAPSQVRIQLLERAWGPNYWPDHGGPGGSTPLPREIFVFLPFPTSPPPHPRLHIAHITRGGALNFFLVCVCHAGFKM